MRKDVMVSADADLYALFATARKITGETMEEAVDTCLRQYIASAMKEKQKEHHTHGREHQEGSKAQQRIPLWANRPNQYNHKIIKAYFRAVDIAGEASLTLMEGLCSDKASPAYYVPTFRNNYASMKLDKGNSHGKVFEDDGDRVWIWEEVKDTLMQYKRYFYEPED